MYNIGDLQRQIDFLENRVELEKINQRFLFNLLDEYFPFIPFKVITLKKGKKLFRGRPTQKGSSFKNVSNFSFVPFKEKKNCTKYGRCNFPTQSLFYSSEDLNVTQIECITHHVDFQIDSLSFMHWLVDEDLTIADIVISELSDMQELQVPVSLIEGKRNHVYNSLKSELNDEQFECIKMVLDFFGRQFAKSNIPSHFHYMYSVYLTNRLLDLNYNGQKVDGLQYPSIPSKYESANIVLRPDVLIDRKLKPIRTFEVMTIINRGTLYSHVTNQSVSIEDNIITWRDNNVTHGGGYFEEIKKTPFERGGQGILTIEIPFDRQKIYETFIKIGEDKKNDLPFNFTLTASIEKFVQTYSNVVYSDGTFAKCEFAEKENRIMLQTNPGFLMHCKDDILFARQGATFSFAKIPNFNFGFIPTSS